MIRSIFASLLLLGFLIITTIIAFTVMYASIKEQAIGRGIISLIMIFIVSSICTSNLIRIKRMNV
ncbi:hypothetical protein [Alkalicoccobacillus plakortidis]|uniref:Uncharacterized protein n=1 Tax=Alkalicoccobacillus plakortidis TaxID=444060 RepID=A0ABT0XIG2_9BACI|nr:hypothetical protein [Alkalicoccobacillus plakortidis]MCM2675505.1 hypothetical protein [Alkalicoccobacillus plakortidis]